MNSQSHDKQTWAVSHLSRTAPGSKHPVKWRSTLRRCVAKVAKLWPKDVSEGLSTRPHRPLDLTSSLRCCGPWPQRGSDSRPSRRLCVCVRALRCELMRRQDCSEENHAQWGLVEDFDSLLGLLSGDSCRRCAAVLESRAQSLRLQRGHPSTKS